jgi:PRTRC genetic system ThiF family protein
MKTHKVNTLISNPYGSTVTITVIGAGGTGSILLTTLARLNQAILRLNRTYLRIRVYDPDRITENNVTRQAYSPSDIGLFKCITLVQRLNRFYNTTWYACPYTWAEDPESVRANLIITCTDTAVSRTTLAPYLPEWNSTTDHPRRFAYWLDLGNTLSTAQVILGGYGAKDHEYTPGSSQISGDEFAEGDWKNRIDTEPIPRLPFVTEMYDLKEYETANPSPSCSLAESLGQQHIMINDLCAKVASCLIWDLFTQERIDWRGSFINLETLNIRKLRIQ